MVKRVILELEGLSERIIPGTMPGLSGLGGLVTARTLGDAVALEGLDRQAGEEAQAQLGRSSLSKEPLSVAPPTQNIAAGGAGGDLERILCTGASDEAFRTLKQRPLSTVEHVVETILNAHCIKL